MSEFVERNRDCNHRVCAPLLIHRHRQQRYTAGFPTQDYQRLIEAQTQPRWLRRSVATSSFVSVELIWSRYTAPFLGVSRSRSSMTVIRWRIDYGSLEACLHVSHIAIIRAAYCFKYRFFITSLLRDKLEGVPFQATNWDTMLALPDASRLPTLYCWRIPASSASGSSRGTRLGRRHNLGFPFFLQRVVFAQSPSFTAL